MAPRPPSSSRDRFIAAAEEMLREVGMSGMGIQDLVARSGAPIGSLYHHFPGGKTQLVGESLQQHAAKLPRLVERFFDGKRSAAAAVRALFDAAADGFERGGAHKACAIGAVTLDLTPSDSAIRRVCRRAFDEWVASITPRLPFPDERTRRSFAVMIVAGLEGAFVLSRAARHGQPFRDVGKWVSMMVSEPDTASARPRQRRRARGARRAP